MQKNNNIIKYKRLISDTFIFAIGNLGSKIILFFMVPLYTNYMSTQEYGIADLVYACAQLLIPIVSIVIFDSTLRFGLSDNNNKDDVLKTSFLVLLIGSIALVIITPAFNFYAPLKEWRWYLTIFVILSMFEKVEMNFLKIIDKNKLYSMISIVRTLVLAFGNLFFIAFAHWGIKGYLLSMVLSSATTVILAFIVGAMWNPLVMGNIDNKLLKEMSFYSIPLILNNLSWWAIQSSNKIMIEAMVGAASLGLFTVATKIPSLINVFISIFSQSWGISSVKEYESTNDKDFYAKVFYYYSFMAFGAALIIISFVKPFMKVYVSEAFIESWKFVPLLLVSASFSAISSYFGTLYGALKKSMNVMFSTAIAALTNIILNFILIQWIGTWGAIIGTLSAYIVIAFYRMIDVLHYINFNPHWKIFLINCSLVLFHALLITFDFQILIVSIFCIMCFIWNNRTLLQLRSFI